MKREKGLILLILTTFVTLSNSQTQTKQRFDEVFNVIKCNESFDSLFIHASTIAISAYPELQNISIEYRQGRLKTIMAARPLVSAIFRQKSKREYQIFLSDNTVNHCDQLFCQMSFQALTGILGHEFAHLLTYNNKSSIQLFFHAFKYLFNKKDIERETDMITIKRGFGKELIEYNTYIFNSNIVSKEYLKNRHNNYLSVNEIQESLDK